MLDLYGASQEQRAELLTVLREVGQLGWMQPLRTELPPVYSDYIGFESEARAISNYESLYIPGLLQTEEYARAVIQGTLPYASTEEVETRVRARLERQGLLNGDDPPRLWTIMDEAAVRRIVGGHAVMRSQIVRLQQAAALPNVTVQVVPYEAGAHPGMHGAFIMLEFPDPTDQSLAYTESLAGGLILEDDLEIRRYILLFDHLRAAAMRPAQTLTLLAEIAEELGKGGAE